MASLYVQKARLAPESGDEIMDQKAACTFETFDDVIGDYAFPARRVLSTDRPPPNSGHPFEVRKDRASPKSTEDLIDETVLPTDRPPPNSGHPFEVRKDRASPKSTEELIDETHACVLEAVLGEYAFPTLLFVPTDRPPPKPGDAGDTRANGSTTTIKLKACGSEAAGEEEDGREMFSCTPKKHGDSKARKAVATISANSAVHWLREHIPAVPRPGRIDGSVGGKGGFQKGRRPERPEGTGLVKKDRGSESNDPPQQDQQPEDTAQNRQSGKREISPKTIGFEWRKEQQDVFDAIQHAIINNARWGGDPTYQYHLATDASAYAYGGVLFQLPAYVCVAPNSWTYYGNTPKQESGHTQSEPWDESRGKLKGN
jgi:hypothetical protein